ALPGRGMQATVDGKHYLLGSARLMNEIGIAPEERADAARFEAAGHTVSWVAQVDDQPTLLGLLAFRDKIKDSAREAVRGLKDKGVRTVMISGDNQAAATLVAKELGIDQVMAEVLPEDKARIIADLKKDGGLVAMVGDGINDAPALAAA